MNWELPKALVDWAQVIGSALSLLALLLALYALYKGRRDTAAERRRQHELEILRDIGDQLTVHDVDQIALGTRLRMLSTFDDFPLTRAALDIHVKDDERRRFEDQLRPWLLDRLGRSQLRPMLGDDAALGERAEQGMQEPGVRWQFVVATSEGCACILRQELDAAIERRMRD